MSVFRSTSAVCTNTTPLHLSGTTAIQLYLQGKGWRPSKRSLQEKALREAEDSFVRTPACGRCGCCTPQQCGSTSCGCCHPKFASPPTTRAEATYLQAIPDTHPVQAAKRRSQPKSRAKYESLKSLPVKKQEAEPSLTAQSLPVERV